MSKNPATSTEPIAFIWHLYEEDFEEWKEDNDAPATFTYQDYEKNFEAASAYCTNTLGLTLEIIDFDYALIKLWLHRNALENTTENRAMGTQIISHGCSLAAALTGDVFKTASIRVIFAGEDIPEGYKLVAEEIPAELVTLAIQEAVELMQAS